MFFDTCVYHQPGIELLLKVVPVDNILFGSEMVGAVRGIDPETGHYFDDTKRYIDAAHLAQRRGPPTRSSRATRGAVYPPRPGCRRWRKHDAKKATMSRAFVKEPDGDAIEALPDRPVSEHPNIVTAQGLAQIDDAIARLQAEHTVAQAAEDRSGRARIARDLRYWTARRASAELSPPPPDTDEIRFGATVTIERDDGRRLTYRIVGEDEADPGARHPLLHRPARPRLDGKERRRRRDAGRAGNRNHRSRLGPERQHNSIEGPAPRAFPASMASKPELSLLV